MKLVRIAVLALSIAWIMGTTAQAQMDLSKMVQAPPKIMLGEGAKVGFRIETKIKAGSMSMSHFVAVVGETEDAWEIETSQYTMGYAQLPDGKGLLMALVVDKKTGDVLLAKLGKPGEALKEIKVMKSPKQVSAKAPEGEEVDYTLPSGKVVKATKTETKSGGNTYTSWSGRKGTELEGVMFKSRGPSYNKELSEDPSQIDYELTDLDEAGKPKTVEGRQLVFSDQSVIVMSKDPVVKALGYGVLVSRGKGSTLEVLSVRTDAKKTLSWN